MLKRASGSVPGVWFLGVLPQLGKGGDDGGQGAGGSGGSGGSWWVGGSGGVVGWLVGLVNDDAHCSTHDGSAVIPAGECEHSWGDIN